MFSRLSPAKFIAAFFYLLFVCVTTNAQLVKKFALKAPAFKIKKSLYNKIVLFDMRPDTTNLGMAQKGFFNRKATVLAEEPLQIQLTKLLTAITDSNARHNELFLQLRQFSFAELSRSNGETGYCYIRAGLFTSKDDKYLRVATIDTVVSDAAFVDVTLEMLKDGGTALSNFIVTNLIKEPKPNAKVYSYSELVNIDSLEKRELKVYNTDIYKDGLYKTYSSFSKQEPDMDFFVNGDSVRKDNVDTLNKVGKHKKVRSGSVYAVVYKGKPYISTAYGYYLLSKVDNDLFFTGKASVQAPIGQIITAEVFFGAVGGLLASNANATFEMKLDHVNGAFIRLKEIKIPEPVEEYHIPKGYVED